jgi:hypothetical protein
MSEDQKKPTLSILSNKRLKQIEDVLRNYIDTDQVDEVIDKICLIMKFNSDYKKGKYTPEIGKKFVEWQRKRVAELGINQSQYRKGYLKTT